MSLLEALVVAVSVGLMVLAGIAADMIARFGPEELEEMGVCLRYGRRERTGTNRVIETGGVPRRTVL
jgi:hypothetical protein